MPSRRSTHWYTSPYVLSAAGAMAVASVALYAAAKRDAQPLKIGGGGGGGGGAVPDGAQGIVRSRAVPIAEKAVKVLRQVFQRIWPALQQKTIDK